jgi:hypothetical protein
MGKDKNMETNVIARLRDWTEPAHPGVVKLYDDLIAIYKIIKENAQARLDAAFDQVSKKIGYVVATTLPVVIEAGEGKSARIAMGAEHLKGTLFEEAITKALSDVSFKGVAEGRYQIYVLWYDALRLKLHTDWMEPAHPGLDRLGVAGQVIQAAGVRPEVREPAHWFDRSWAWTVEEAVLISAIDAVYPELRLGTHIAAVRQMQRPLVRPEVKEPAHTHVAGAVQKQ